ncbi:hypothetical protein T12_9132 [Trichinella patagoniensis]|uniref:Uncharacterized protein n=1 Tax=Trichinella patagoniensis TaxID=990121 RepID=A0A0V0ZKK1_9BILA|nr:hypothetical protein T12_9132 [Trichinella patagoniensis]
MRANKANGRGAMDFRTEKKNDDNDINVFWCQSMLVIVRNCSLHMGGVDLNTMLSEELMDIVLNGLQRSPKELIQSVCRQYLHLRNRSRKTSLTNNVNICPFSTFVTTFTSVIPKVGDIAPLGAVEGWKGGGK